MSDQDLFSREYKVIEQAEQLLQSGDFMDNQLYSPYRKLLEAYKKLFRQSNRLVKMGDRMQNDLNKLNAELQCHKEKLSQMSYVDGLTSIFNRRRFNEYLESEWKRSLRNKEPLSLIILDIDFFKQFNDHYGHSAGDDCLVLVAEALSSCIKRSSDQVSRFGGEEFAVILPNTELSAAWGLAETIQASIRKLAIVHEYSQVSPYITASIGIASVVPDENDSQMELLETADRQLYVAKEAGRNQIQGQEGLGQTGEQ